MKPNEIPVIRDLEKGDAPKSAANENPIYTKHLVDIAILLAGVNLGKGNLLPLGTDHLSELWRGIKFIEKIQKDKIK